MPYWPTPAQEALLWASDPRGQSNPSHWLGWRSSTDFDDLDRPSQQLIPLLYANLNRLGIADSNLGRYRGFYRRTWYLNRLLFHRIGEVLGACHRAGIPTLLVGGAALVHRSYHDPRLRRVDRGTIIVPPTLAAAAVRRLQARGWQLVGRSPRCLTWVLPGGPDNQGVVLQGQVLPGFWGARPTPSSGAPPRRLHSGECRPESSDPPISSSTSLRRRSSDNRRPSSAGQPTSCRSCTRKGSRSIGTDWCGWLPSVG